MRGLLLLIGLPPIPGDQIALVLVIVALAIGLVGFVADAVLGENGFGVIGNAVITTASAIAGMALWHRFAPSVGLTPLETAALSASLSILAALVGSGFLRRYI